MYVVRHFSAQCRDKNVKLRFSQDGEIEIIVL